MPNDDDSQVLAYLICKNEIVFYTMQETKMKYKYNRYD
jgi:hypothetical protein